MSTKSTREVKHRHLNRGLENIKELKQGVMALIQLQIESGSQFDNTREFSKVVFPVADLW